jgi:hypothetical protein
MIKSMRYKSGLNKKFTLSKLIINEWIHQNKKTSSLKKTSEII